LPGCFSLFEGAKTCFNERMAKFRRRQLRDAYRFPGFVPAVAVRGLFGDPKARIVSLHRRRKKRRAASVGVGVAVTTTDIDAECGICRAATRGFTWSWTFAASLVRSAKE